MSASKDPLIEAERRRKISEAQKGKCYFLGKRHSEESKRKISESERGKRNHNFGKHHSEETRKKMSDAQMGKHGYWTGKKHSDATKKKMSESRKGEKSYYWKGGISYEPYCPLFNDEFKERVRAFFGHQCVECGTPQNGYKLHVHHVNFNKKSCCDDSIPLFVPLCLPCHSKIQKNREYWESHFTGIIESYYQGKCYFSKEEFESLSRPLNPQH
ncbi:MAG: NUMOD3 domain-containing DNA-binding protein [Thermoplasmata archaeon]|nr:NUMOD3 domain-containing DNA-binding protein [Thermoplasmata archaeon]